MSEKRSAADVAVQGATNRAALDLCLEPMRLAARGLGYAIALHGSVSRDIDLIAIPWEEHASDPDRLFDALEGAIAGALGKCRSDRHFAPKKLKGQREWKEKPHGRRVSSMFAYVGGTHIHFDLGVMPRVPKAED